ncbi:MAG: hypothetical protein WCJ39_08810, partial [bacterium]
MNTKNIKKIISGILTIILFSSFSTAIAGYGTNDPSASTLPVTDLMHTSVTLNGSSDISVHNAGTITTYFRYAQSDTAPNINGGTGAWANISSKDTAHIPPKEGVDQVGKVSEVLTNLIPNKKYYYAFYMEYRPTMSGGVDRSWGEISSFTTYKSAPCIIKSFTANPTTLNNQITTSALSWSLSDCSSAEISPTPGSVTPSTGTLNVSPTSTTSYVLSAHSLINNQTASVSVTIPSVFSHLEGKSSEILTNPATEKTSIGARLNGSLIAGTNFPPGLNTRVYFRYSALTDNPPVFCNDIYGSKMKSTSEIQITPTASKQTNFSSIVNNLSPDTQYYFCAVASSNEHIMYGEVQPLITSPDETMTIATKNPLVSNDTSVYLNGTFNTKTNANTWFEYRKITTTGKSDLYSSSFNYKGSSLQKNTTNSQNSKTSKQGTVANWSDKQYTQNHSSNESGNISYLLKGLSPSTTYEYQAVIQPDSGSAPIYGDPIQFTTLDTKKVDVVDPGNGGGNGNNNGNTDPGYVYIPVLKLGQI